MSATYEMRLKEIVKVLEDLAPPVLQESYDNSGLLVGNPEWIVTSAMVCLDSTEDVVEEAIQKGCNLIVAHHPIVFGGLKRFNGSNYIERTIIKAIKNDIAIYAIHTNLDNVIHGVNGKIAEKLELKSCKILSVKKQSLTKLVVYCPTSHAAGLRETLFEAGAGKIGNYDESSFNSEGVGTFRANESAQPFVGNINEQHQEPETKIEVVVPNHLLSKVIPAMVKTHPYEEVAYDLFAMENTNPNIGSGIVGELNNPMSPEDFLSHLKEKMNLKSVRLTKSTSAKISKVAVCGGSGSFLLNDAIRSGADVFVSADFKYHQFFDADGKIQIADIGHYESEQYTMQLLAEYLSGKFPKFAVHFTTVNTNPINYC